MAIAAAEGPVLITAGPGTGKTYTLVQRAIYLIEECGVKPESIFIATFTEKAAKELITRITNELSERGIVANINEMYIGTFHSLCLRILKEHLEYTRLRRNYRLLDAFDQQYMVFQNIHRFRNIPEVEIALPNGGAWKQSETICNYVNNLSEELVTPEELMADSDLAIAALGRMLKEYRDILIEGNLMDFSSIQIEAYHLLYDHADILEEMRSKVTHIMVDEYQDTNFIQEQLVFLLAGNRKNICVVGDDDQGLYRFRGAITYEVEPHPVMVAAESACYATASTDGSAETDTTALEEGVKYTSFEVYNVNNYDFFRNPVEARDLLISALEIQPFPQSDVWDGELDGRMVKIMPVNRIATKADLKELLANLPYKTYEKRKEEKPNQPVERITIVCMGHEPDLKGALEQELSDYKIDVQIVDILRDKKDIQLKRDSEAEIVREGDKLIIRAFYPMNLMQKLSLQKEYVEDWRQLVDSIMIDWNYDGVVMQPTVTDVPGKNEMVKGIYDIPEGCGTIKVKITDLLSESLEVEVR